MAPSGIHLELPPVGALGVLLPFVGTPLAVVSMVLVWLRLRKAPDETRIIEALDRVLAADSETLRREQRSNPLKFRTSDQVQLDGAAIGWGLRPGRVKIIRTVRAATKAGYRLRLRAFARGAHGRLIVRAVDVDLRRRS